MKEQIISKYKKILKDNALSLIDCKKQLQISYSLGTDKKTDFLVRQTYKINKTIKIYKEVIKDFKTVVDSMKEIEIKVELQRSINDNGFWIYLVNSKGKRFMLKYIKYKENYTDDQRMNIQELGAIEEAKNLINFMLIR